MNAFTDMRKRYYESKANESFAEYYLTHRCYVSEQDDADRYALIIKIAAIRDLFEREIVSDEEILLLLQQIGDQIYLDRYIVELLIQHKDQLQNSIVQDVLLKTMAANDSTPQIKIHIVDLCIECEMPLFRDALLRDLFLAHRHEHYVFSSLLEYALHFSIKDLSDLLFDFLSEEYPVNSKLQIIEYLFEAVPNRSELKHMIHHQLGSDENIHLYLAYLKFLHEKTITTDCGIIVVQTMFYGDPENSGKGQSGGLGTLLKSLGNQLSKQKQISQVITLTINNDWQERKAFISQFDNGHYLIRLPVYLSPNDPHAFIRRELAIKRAVARFLSQRQIAPDIIHVRYLDNASKAIALLSKEISSKLVFTLTPDPHRNMVDEDGNILCFKVDETLEKLNKITIGDELLVLADGIVGIGADDVRRELELYFPQLNRLDHESAFRMIGEGIDTEIQNANFDLWQFMEDHSLGFRIDPGKSAKPIILNVGRLSTLKGQHHLMKAWGESRLWRDYNLVIIGGSHESADESERSIKTFFATYLSSNPNLAGRFAHVEALPNEAVRRLEHNIMEQEAPSRPNLYVCSSAKEEFGISILEALSEGFLTFAPIKGGVKTYIVDGINGFLVDTSNEATLCKDIEKVIYHSNRSRFDFQKVQQNGKNTVLRQFSMEEISKHFMALYLGLSEYEESMCIINTSSF